MRRRRGWIIFYQALSWVQALGAGAIVVFSTASYQAPGGSTSWPNWLEGTALALRAWAFPVVPILLLVVAVAQEAKRRIGAPWEWETVQTILNYYRDSVFRRLKGDPHHYHRVTLFKYVSWRWPIFHKRWPGIGWLVPVSRSGYTTQRTKALYRAPDNADKAEGIAGLAWSTGETRIVSNLPDITGTTVVESSYRKYANLTRLDIERVRVERPKSRSLCGFPIRAKTDVWGVVVLDSRAPDGLTSTEYASHRDEQRMLAQFLGKILERA